jgi:hypothetical protein
MSVLPSFSPLTNASLGVPVSAICDWLTVIEEPNASGGGVSANDLGSSNIPFVVSVGQIVDSRKLVFRRSQLIGGVNTGFGTSLRARLLYPVDVTSLSQNVVTPVLKLFAGPLADRGRMTSVRNLLGETSVQFPIDPAADSSAKFPSSPGDVELKVATPDNMAHTWDCDGCEYFIFGVERAWSYTGGPGKVQLQVKFV